MPPLFPLSPNVKALPGVAGKRAHDTFIDAANNTASQAFIDPLGCENLCVQKQSTMSTTAAEPQAPLEPPSIPVTNVATTESPPVTSPIALSESGPSTPTSSLPSSDTMAPESSEKAAPPAQPKATTTPSIPATKRKRNATADEKEKERAEKKQKKDNAAAQKAEKLAEREAERAAKAIEKGAKAAEKAAKAAEKATKAREKAKVDALKEEQKRKKADEELAAKAKQEKQKNLMASFLKKGPTTLSNTNDHSKVAMDTDVTIPLSKQEDKPAKSAYQLSFQPFFIKPGVTMAAPPFDMDNNTKEAKSAILDELIRGERGEFNPKRPFDATETFQLAFPQQRGIIPPSVRKIMEKVHGDSSEHAFGITNARSESQNEKIISNAQDRLNSIPMKYLRFYEDVRPAYFGTVTTTMTCHQLRKLARRPMGRILPLAYDYDSEAEWVEDDGEDLDDAEDEEEELDGDEEMDDFVDDSEAVPTIIRPGFQADSVPVSTGLCFENERRQGPSSTMYKYRLEFLMGSLVHDSSINPFSTEYWPTSAKKGPSTSTASSTKGAITSMLPPTAPWDTSASAIHKTPASGIKDGVPRDILEEFKRTLLSDECRDYTKSTVIELLAKKFTTCTKAQVKATLDTIAHRVTPAEAPKKSIKRWSLLPSFALEAK
ncbi:chromatin assembly factor 1 subunit A-domain-containing protein [Nemania sp. FL0916]|nr:chromatin assembly factor 1 subunit A-domain-containing protein [Nemania sp. FL0916]